MHNSYISLLLIDIEIEEYVFNLFSKYRLQDGQWVPKLE